MKRSVICLAFSLLISGCLGASSPQPIIESPALPYSMPSLIGTACTSAVQYSPSSPAPTNEWFVAVFYQGSKKINYACSGTLTDTIDSTQYPYQPIAGGGADTQLNFEPVPWIPFGKGLEFDAMVSIPAVSTTPGNVAQFGPGIYLHSKQGDTIAYVMEAFDSRPGYCEQSAQTDGSVYFIGTCFMQDSPYSTTLAGATTNVPFAVAKPFNIAITAAQLTYGITQINEKFGKSLSTNPDDWSLSLVGFGAELSPAVTGSDMIQFTVQPTGVFAVQ